jgi:hypothetical protein
MMLGMHLESFFKKRFRVLLKGQNFLLSINGEPHKVGFFTTRVVGASTSEEAAARSLNAVWMDERLESRTNSPDEPPEVTVEEVQEVPWLFRRLRPPRGFSFYVLDEEPDRTPPES